jgi:hypothetical protein
MAVTRTTICDLCGHSTDVSDDVKACAGWEEARWTHPGGGTNYVVAPLDICPTCADDRGWHN